jgi:phosphatidylserine decarboxylase
MLARLFVLFQYLVPQHWLTALVWRIARIRHTATKNFLIEKFVAMYDVDIDEVLQQVPDDFPTFNDFFIRELVDTARPVKGDVSAVVSPVDGTVSVASAIEGDSIFQAKGIDYSLTDLLATDLDSANAFVDGSFATIYLAPYNYHRVHSPIDGELVAANYIPGDLFSVNQATVANVRGLFGRNERLVMHFQTNNGPAALVFVGALNVGSISTPWTGEIRPRKRGVVEALNLSRHSTTIQKGSLLGWFNLGSTVVLLLPARNCEWHDDLKPGASLRVGEVIGTLSKPFG